MWNRVVSVAGIQHYVNEKANIGKLEYPSPHTHSGNQEAVTRPWFGTCGICGPFVTWALDLLFPSLACSTAGTAGA